jgi:hypothetical protein
MQDLLKLALRNVKLIPKRLARQVAQKLDPLEREFRKVWPSINSIDGLLVSPIQERWLFRTARSLPDRVIIVEIGSFKGRSTCCLLYGCRGTHKHVFAIDTFAGNTTDFKQGEPLYSGLSFSGQFLDDFRSNIEKRQLSSYVTPIQGWSSEIAKTWNKPIHLLFIDGSHKYEDVLADFEGFFPHVVPGGIIAFHDVVPNWPGPFRVWQEVASKLLFGTGKCSTLAFGKKHL